MHSTINIINFYTFVHTFIFLSRFLILMLSTSSMSHNSGAHITFFARPFIEPKTPDYQISPVHKKYGHFIFYSLVVNLESKTLMNK